MKITANLSKGWLNIREEYYFISCNVRTLRDGTRASTEVVLSIPGNTPYDPRPFPKGLWNVTGIEWQKEKGFDENTYGPVKIRTDAKQRVKAWELDKDGDYFKETDLSVEDGGYLLHYSKSSTTLGCIRLASSDDAEKVAKFIQAFLGRGGWVELEVV